MCVYMGIDIYVYVYGDAIRHNLYAAKQIAKHYKILVHKTRVK